MQIKYSTGTNKGKVRKRNEDNYSVVDCDAVDFMVFAVADGMGGMDFGDLASLEAKNILEETFENCKKAPGCLSDAEKIFTELFNSINKKIIEICAEKRSATGMGTTLSVCLMNKEKIYVGHIGDSRIYLVGKNGIRQITKDHSYVEELINGGKITREQARTHPKRNIITRALGLEAEIEVDIFEKKISVGDSILLCTDGLTNAVEDSKIFSIIKNNGPDETVKLLIGKANEYGGKDNITVLLVNKEE